MLTFLSTVLCSRWKINGYIALHHRAVAMGWAALCFKCLQGAVIAPSTWSLHPLIRSTWGRRVMDKLWSGHKSTQRANHCGQAQFVQARMPSNGTHPSGCSCCCSYFLCIFHARPTWPCMPLKIACDKHGLHVLGACADDSGQCVMHLDCCSCDALFRAMGGSRSGADDNGQCAMHLDCCNCWP